MNFTLALTALLTLGVVEVQVEPLNGPAVSGELASLSSQRAAVVTQEGELDLPLNELLAVDFKREDAAAASSATMWVELTDGSRLAAVSYQVYGGEAAIALAGGGELKVETRKIRHALLRPHDEALARQWTSVTGAAVKSDTIVVRKPTSDGGFSLDSAEGLLQDMTPRVVRFEFDGEMIDVPRERVEGVIYYHPVGRSLPEPICEVIDTAGSHWRVKSLGIDGDQLRLATVAGLEADVPLERVARLDFSLGKLLYLSDLKPGSVRVDPGIPLSQNDRDELSEYLARFNRPRHDEVMGGAALRLDEQTFPKGLELASRTQISFSLPDAYRKLTGLAGFDANVPAGSKVEIVFVGDGKELARQAIVAEGSEPTPLEIDLGGARRLQIRVEHLDKRQITHRVHLCNLRISK
jgi:hypothetical protein